MFPIAEIFKSYQAEGRWAGLPTVFVRFAGCNYSCSWCDTDFSVKRRMTAEQIATEASMLFGANPSVCFTGGEPCLHDLGEVMDEIDRLTEPRRVFYQIETNGSCHHEKYMHRCFVTVSPKGQNGEPLEGGDYFCHQLKVVYQGQDLRAFAGRSVAGDAEKYAQPLDDCGKFNWEETLAACARYGWSMSLQTNKWLGAK